MHKLILERKILPLLLPGFNLTGIRTRNLLIMSELLYQKAIYMQTWKKKEVLGIYKFLVKHAVNWITQRPSDYRKEMQTEVVWTCLLFSRSGQNHLSRHSERGKKTRQIEEEVGRQHQRMDRPEVCQVPEGSGEQRKIEETGCEVICVAPVTL